MFAVGHLDEGVGEVCLAGLLPREPDLMEALPTDAATQVSMELGETRWPSSASSSHTII